MWNQKCDQLKGISCGEALAAHHIDASLMKSILHVYRSPFFASMLIWQKQLIIPGILTLRRKCSGLSKESKIHQDIRFIVILGRGGGRLEGVNGRKKGTYNTFNHKDLIFKNDKAIFKGLLLFKSEIIWASKWLSTVMI